MAGDGGFGQYAMELTTAVRYQLPIKLVLLNNSEIGKISKEQRGVNVPVWATSLVNPDFAAFARSCGAWGKQIRRNDEIREGLARTQHYRRTGPPRVHDRCAQDMIPGSSRYRARTE